MTILPADPLGGYRAHQEEILAAVASVLAGGQYILGEETTAFEREFAAYVGARRCIGVASGTDALVVGLRALGIGPGDAVVTVSHTAVATVAAIELAGATPVLVDIDAGSFTMSPGSLKEALAALAPAHRFKAILPVHLYGQPADIKALEEVSGDLAILEDCAQAHGATAGGEQAGTLGKVAAFSFYPTKNLGAFGDGGAIVTSDDSIAEQARILREYGWRRRYISDEPGLNSRLDELQAAILRVKLRYLDAENDRRREIAGFYTSRLQGTSYEAPLETPGTRHVYHQYVIRSARRDDLRSFLMTKGIGTLVHYPVPCHLQPAYEGRLALAPGGLGVTEKACREILSLPVQPTLSDAEVESVCDALLEFERG